MADALFQKPEGWIHEKVEFAGSVYWLHCDGIGDTVLLSPLAHYDQDGELTCNPFRDLSYAVVTPDGEIKRYRRVIGNMQDILRSEPQKEPAND
jgi:hypothetical protein